MVSNVMLSTLGLHVRLYTFLPILSLSVVYLSLHLSACLPVCLSVCVFICHLKFIEGRTVTNIKFDKETSESQETTEMSFHLCFGFLFFNDWGEPE